MRRGQPTGTTRAQKIRVPVRAVGTGTGRKPRWHSVRKQLSLASFASLLAPIVLLGAPIHGIGVTTAAAAPPTPFTQCPAVGFSPSCGTLIIVNPDRSVSVYTDPNVGTLDSVGGDDTLIGIENQSSQPLTALTV